MAIRSRAVVNGIDVEELGHLVTQVKQQPELGRFRFHIRNKWIDGGRNQSTIESFFGTGQEMQHQRPFTSKADEPPILLGQDKAPNPVEYLLHALASCMTSSLVYHAAMRGIKVTEVESTLEGDLDTSGFMGISPQTRKGYENIRVTFRVKSDAPPEQLEECARFSPVLDVVSHGTNVDLKIEKQ